MHVSVSIFIWIKLLKISRWLETRWNTVFRENIIGPILFALCYDQYLPFFYSFISFYFTYREPRLTRWVNSPPGKELKAFEDKFLWKHQWIKLETNSIIWCEKKQWLRSIPCFNRCQKWWTFERLSQINKTVFKECEMNRTDYLF